MPIPEHLLAEPHSALLSRTYRTGRASYSVGGVPDTTTDAVRAGGRCHVESVSRANVTSLVCTPDPDGGDAYYYPFVSRGVGFVEVPEDAPNGTVVLTEALTGCAVEVRRRERNLRFYHDANGCAMADSQHEDVRWGERVQRWAYADYDRGANQAYSEHLERYNKNGGGKSWAGFFTGRRDGEGEESYANYIIAMKRGGGWEIYNTASYITRGEGKHLGLNMWRLDGGA